MSLYSSGIWQDMKADRTVVLSLTCTYNLAHHHLRRCPLVIDQEIVLMVVLGIVVPKTHLKSVENQLRKFSMGVTSQRGGVIQRSVDQSQMLDRIQALPPSLWTQPSHFVSLGLSFLIYSTKGLYAPSKVSIISPFEDSLLFWECLFGWLGQVIHFVEWLFSSWGQEYLRAWKASPAGSFFWSV